MESRPSNDLLSNVGEVIEVQQVVLIHEDLQVHVEPRLEDVRELIPVFPIDVASSGEEVRGLPVHVLELTLLKEVHS